MDFIKLFILVIGNWIIVFFIFCLNCVKFFCFNCFLIVLLCKLLLIDLNMFFIGFRLGLCGGILSNFVFICCKVVFVIVEFWFGLLFWMKSFVFFFFDCINICLKVFLIKDVKKFFVICLYLWYKIIFILYEIVIKNLIIFFLDLILFFFVV